MSEFSLEIPQREDIEQSGFGAYRPPETVELDSHSLECNWHNMGRNAVEEVVILSPDLKE